MKIVVMGQGYVGLPLAMAAAKAGHKVVGYEPDKRRYDLLNSGISYVEDVSSDRILRRMEEGLYEPTTDENKLSNFDVAVITVPTPLKRGMPDLSYVSTAVLMLADKMKQGAVVILESTVAPGTTRRLVAGMIERNTGWLPGVHFHVGFSPERIDPGNQDWTLETTPKIVSGLTPECAVEVFGFYRTVLSGNLVVAGSLEEAELAKVFENTFRQVNIALVNELQRHARQLGVDVWNTLDLAATKPFGFTKFTPGPGVGGHCLPVDPVYLAHQTRTELGAPFRLVELAQEINDGQPGYVVRRLQDALNRRAVALQGSKILALGQAYKPDTSDMRESPAVEVVSLMRDLGAAVDTVDPFIPPPCADNEYTDIPVVVGTEHLRHLREDYHAVVLLTPHSAFDLQAVADSGVYVLDTRGVMPDAPNVERL